MLAPTDCTRLVHLWDPPSWAPNSTYFYLEIPLLFVLQIYTPKRHNLHRSYQSRGRLPWICAIFRVLYECPFPLFKARQRIISCLRNMRRIWSVESHTLFFSGFLKRCSLEAASSPWRILISVEGAKNCPDGAPRENIGIKQAGARGGRIIASPPWREVHVQGVLSHNSAILLLWSTWLPWFTFTFYFSMWWSSPSRKWCNPVCIQSRLK